MPVHRLHTFTLDEATRDAGVVIANAGSGLPRRITAGIDYAARVLALNPSGYWRLSEAAGAFPDLSGGGRNMSMVGTAGEHTRAVAGSGIGGDPALALYSSSGSAYAAASAAHPEHTLTVGQPFSAFVWARRHSSTTWGFEFGSRLNGSATVGWCIRFAPQGSVQLRDGAANTTITPCAQVIPDDGRFHLVGFTYDGNPAIPLGSIIIYVDGVAAFATHSGTTPTGTLTGNALRLTASSYAPHSMQDIAVWNNRALTAQEVAALASPSIGKARWARTFASDATIRGLLVPGQHRINATGMRCLRAYVSLDAGLNRTELEPASPAVSVPVAAGQTLTLDVEATHHAGAPLPFVADASGNGPGLLYEEALPPVSLPTAPTGSATHDPVPSPPLGRAVRL